jgi:S-adenosylmethionine hydrolase
MVPAIPPAAPPGGIAGTIVHVDHFGNCVTTLARADLPHPLLARGFRLRAGAHEIRTLRRFFAETGAETGEAFAIWGSSELLEIAVNGASAAERLGLRRGDPVLLLPA